MTETTTHIHSGERACTRCGACLPACPQALSPLALHLAIRALDWPQVLALRIDACTECAACEPVCPSAIALVADFRYARAELAWRAREQQRADAARARYQARQRRLAVQTSEQRDRLLRAASGRATDAASNAQAAIQAALARARAKQKRPS